ncbi:hypothetical protein ISS85_05105 [Candidatus Microgenomates bacterium]|nr:hypothetical protein [Candidatus Microgenomates bacterium]
MKRRFKTINIRETEIEDVLVSYPQITANIIEFKGELKLIARQMIVPSGRIDLLFLGKTELFLIELKVEKFNKNFVDQIVSYREDLLKLQQNSKLIDATINSFLLLPSYVQTDELAAKSANVSLKKYSPAEVLETFFRKLSSLSSFLTVRPMDYGVWNIHLINRGLSLLIKTKEIEELVKKIGISKNSIRNQLRLGEQLGLVSKLKKQFYLTETGQEYVKNMSKQSSYVLTNNQVEILRDFIVHDPFYSPTIFGIFTLVEAVFILARNGYPVDIKDLIEFYKHSVGKKFEWKTERSAFLGTRAFRNFAVELGLLGVVGDRVFLTPAGLKFILMLQLHKGIKIVDAMRVK